MLPGWVILIVYASLRPNPESYARFDGGLKHITLDLLRITPGPRGRSIEQKVDQWAPRDLFYTGAFWGEIQTGGNDIEIDLFHNGWPNITQSVCMPERPGYRKWLADSPLYQNNNTHDLILRLHEAPHGKFMRVAAIHDNQNYYLISDNICNAYAKSQNYSIPDGRSFVPVVHPKRNSGCESLDSWMGFYCSFAENYLLDDCITSDFFHKNLDKSICNAQSPCCETLADHSVVLFRDEKMVSMMKVDNKDEYSMVNDPTLTGLSNESLLNNTVYFQPRWLNHSSTIINGYQITSVQLGSAVRTTTYTLHHADPITDTIFSLDETYPKLIITFMREQKNLKKCILKNIQAYRKQDYGDGWELWPDHKWTDKELVAFCATPYGHNEDLRFV